MLTVDDQPVAFSMPIGLLEDFLAPLPSPTLDRQPETSWQSAVTSRDRCVLLCRWLN
ncbi:putative signal peptide and transmembrane protein [Rhodopirellula islandica]|uniref:Signal peptide and transmembrane protein n=1 Tax=Rhodopirellula islandica TaxID=595434 RepID=A0A0J1EEQ0_RHOIS|nr:putative signal peptide and transmembrane protein [Rhodopirellula islandica]